MIVNERVRVELRRRRCLRDCYASDSPMESIEALAKIVDTISREAKQETVILKESELPPQTHGIKTNWRRGNITNSFLTVKGIV